MNIKRVDHLESLLGSIDKMFLNAKNKGVIRNKELSLVNLIFKLLKAECFNDNINKDKQDLTSIYYRLLNKYSFLCKANLSDKSYYFKSNTTNLTNICIEVLPEPIVLDDVIITLIGELQDDEFSTILYNNILENYLNIISNISNSEIVSITITSLPNDGELFLGEDAITIGQTLTVEEFEEMVYNYAIVIEDYPTRQDQYFNYYVTDENNLDSNEVTATLHLMSNLPVPNLQGNFSENVLYPDTSERIFTAFTNLIQNEEDFPFDRIKNIRFTQVPNVFGEFITIDGNTEIIQGVEYDFNDLYNSAAPFYLFSIASTEDMILNHEYIIKFRFSNLDNLYSNDGEWKITRIENNRIHTLVFSSAYN